MLFPLSLGLEGCIVESLPGHLPNEPWQELIGRNNLDVSSLERLSDSFFSRASLKFGGSECGKGM